MVAMEPELGGTKQETCGRWPIQRCNPQNTGNWKGYGVDVIEGGEVINLKNGCVANVNNTQSPDPELQRKSDWRPGAIRHSQLHKRTRGEEGGTRPKTQDPQYGGARS